jgi:NAD(P)-dependent dehydrogenase (short-subunit alcohol dehydrogenase family)
VKVFLTGASSGLGAALARRYAAAGATALGLYARRADQLQQLAATLAPTACSVYSGDVRDAASLRAAAHDFMARHGTPDIVIANAGVSIGTLTAHEDDNDAFRTVLDTNVLGMVHTFQPFLSVLVAGKRGKLVGVASVAGFRGLPGSGAYSASKAAAISYLESLRVELAGSGVEVITLCPGYIATPMTEKNPYPMPFLLSADEAARLVERAIRRGRRFYVFPWQMACVGRLLRALPRAVYDLAFSRAPRKPRGNSAP